MFCLHVAYTSEKFDLRGLSYGDFLVTGMEKLIRRMNNGSLGEQPLNLK